MSGYTPGPWTRGYGNYVYRDDGSPRDGQSLIATCMPLNGAMDELQIAFANARLIAAAPELLEALEDMLTLMGPLDDVEHIRRKQAALAAIAKAKGAN